MAALAMLTPEWPLAGIRTNEQILASSVAQRRFSMVLAAVFASMSLARAAIGIAGGVMASRLFRFLFGWLSDPFTCFAAATVVVLAAAIACYLRVPPRGWTQW